MNYVKKLINVFFEFLKIRFCCVARITKGKKKKKKCETYIQTHSITNKATQHNNIKKTTNSYKKDSLNIEKKHTTQNYSREKIENTKVKANYKKKNLLFCDVSVEATHPHSH